MKRDGVNSNVTFICNSYSYTLLAFSLLVVIVEVNMSICDTPSNPIIQMSTSVNIPSVCARKWIVCTNIGIPNFYCKFLPHTSTKIKPLVPYRIIVILDLGSSQCGIATIQIISHKHHVGITGPYPPAISIRNISTIACIAKSEVNLVMSSCHRVD